MTLVELLPWWIWAPYFVLWLYVMITLIMEDREPGDTLAWAFALLLLPVVGILFYAIAGRDWATITAKQKWIMEYVGGVRAKMRAFLDRNAGADKRFREEFGGTYVERLSDTMLHEDGLGVVTADGAEIFPTGEEKFARLKADLAAAKRFIHVQYFIWENDELTDALADILTERAKAGVQVRFLYDYVGSITWSKKKLDELKAAGGTVTGDVTSLRKINYRDHRKIVVIDGEVGYTGGFNVGQEYVDGGKRFERWRDTHLRVTGQVVGELQSLFSMRWYEQTKEDVLVEEYMPAPAENDGADGILCQVVAHSVEDSWQSSRRAHMVAIGNAEKQVWIQSPYFVPEIGLYDTMVNAALSGVDVRFMMTGMPDKKAPYWAAWTYFRRLLDAGAKIYLYKAGFLHAKTIAVDSRIMAAGTMNMDTRSLRLHKEVMLWLFDEEMAKKQEAIYLEDIENCHEVTLAELDALSRGVRFRNSFMRLLSYFI